MLYLCIKYTALVEKYIETSFIYLARLSYLCMQNKITMQREYLEQQLLAAEEFAQPILKKYYAEGTQAYEIIITHSRQVTRKAMNVLLQHPELKVDVAFVLEAAYLHDIGVFLCDAPAIECYGTHRYIEHGYLGADLLRKEGLTRHALVAERHTGVGITKSQIEQENLPLPRDRHYEADSLEEKIVSYADKFYSKTHLDEEVINKKIVKKLMQHGEDAVKRFEEWNEMFG